MIDSIASPGDPIFYLHHSFLDKVWWDWQALDLPSRLTDMGGQNVQDVFDIPQEPGNFTLPPGFPPLEAMVPPAEPHLPEGDDGGDVTTLAHILNMFGIIPNATIEEVMDIGADVLCYEYV